MKKNQSSNYLNKNLKYMFLISIAEKEIYNFNLSGMIKDIIYQYQFIKDMDSKTLQYIFINN